MRWAPFSGSTLAPYAVPIFRSVSQISGKAKWFVSAKFRLSSTVSKEMPMIAAPF